MNATSNNKNRLSYYFVPLPDALLLDTVSREAVCLWGTICLLQRTKRLQSNAEISRLMPFPISRNTIQRMLNELESAGWLIWNRRSSGERFVLLTKKHDGAGMGGDGAGMGDDGAGVGDDGAGVNHLKTRANPTGRAKKATRLCDRHETHESEREISHSHSHSHSLTDEQIEEIKKEEARKFKERLRKKRERSGS
jgi:hypothetical protein